MREEKGKDILVVSRQWNQFFIQIELVFIKVIFEILVKTGGSHWGDIREIITLEPIKHPKFELFKPYRFDDIIARSILESETESVDIRKSTDHHDGYAYLFLPDDADDPISSEFQSIVGKLKVHENDIIGWYDG